MAIEVNTASAICSKCGKSFGRRRGNFSANYGLLYKGIGFVTVCKECVDSMYNSYLSQCNDARAAVRQMCRKLDLYWSDKVYDAVAVKNTSRTMMTNYIIKINTSTYVGKSYDDTLSEEGTLWEFGGSVVESTQDDAKTKAEEDVVEVPDEIIAFWGSGYSPEMYEELERKRSYWMSKYPSDTELDIGTETIIKQICSLELDINRDRANGKSVDKSIGALNTLLGSANLKPVQNRNDEVDATIEKMPLGVWAKKIEDERPIKEADPEFKDVDGIIRYITVWFFGHLCKSLKIKNVYSKMYEQEIAKFRVEHPEYDDEDDEELFDGIFGGDVEDEDGDA